MPTNRAKDPPYSFDRNRCVPAAAAGIRVEAEL